MKPMGDSRRHYWLVKGMAHKLGADLTAAFDTGELSPEDWSGMVEACRTCAEPGRCRRWLDTREDATAAPGYCKNAARLEGLARG